MVDRVDIRTILSHDERKGICQLIDDHPEIDYPQAFSYGEWKRHEESVYLEDLATLYFMLRATPNEKKYFPTSTATVMRKILEAIDREYQVEVAMSFGKLPTIKRK